MRKGIIILSCILSLGLFGCTQNNEAKLEQIDDTVLKEYQQDEPNKDGIVYSINKKDYCYIVF